MKLIGRMEEVDCSGDFKPVAVWVRDTPPPPLRSVFADHVSAAP